MSLTHLGWLSPQRKQGTMPGLDYAARYVMNVFPPPATYFAQHTACVDPQGSEYLTLGLGVTPLLPYSHSPPSPTSPISIPTMLALQLGDGSATIPPCFIGYGGMRYRCKRNQRIVKNEG